METFSNYLILFYLCFVKYLLLLYLKNCTYTNLTKCVCVYLCIY